MADPTPQAIRPLIPPPAASAARGGSRPTAEVRLRRTQQVMRMIRSALKEDAAFHDATSRAIIPKHLDIRASIIAKERGVAAGIKVAALTFTTLDPSLRCRVHRRSGDRISAGTPILTVEGRARSIFAAERVALNVLGHLSGIATLTAEYVRRVHGTKAKIFDTRKTLPGLRMLEKYAVRAGGGHNHRMNLADAILIKTNHVLAYSVERIAYRRKPKATLTELVREAKAMAGRRAVEVEVRNLAEFKAALAARPDAILLDNWPLRVIKKAVLYATRYTLNAGPLLEVSGGVTLSNVRAIAKTGVDRISIGRLTHSAPFLDVSLRVY